MNLPADIHKLIISALDAPVPLFTPSYVFVNEPAFSYGSLKKKHAEYYGKRNDDALVSSQALLNWSATCRFYRELLAPTIFQDVLLRPRTESMSSVKLLSTTAHWKHVRSLAVVGTYAYKQWHEDMDPFRTGMVGPFEALNYGDLLDLRVLASLPPNLECLTLDFPNNWTSVDNYLSVFNEIEQPEQTQEIEAENLWRMLIYNVLATTAKNDISTKESFELRLLNVPPLPCSVYRSKQFHEFLNHVTRLTLAFDHFDNCIGWNMNTMEGPVDFCSKLGERFWDHLSNIKTLKIHADGSWPIGLAPGRCHMPLALPSNEKNPCFAKLEELEVKWWLIDQELVTLVSKHMPMLMRLTMSNYFAGSRDSGISEARKPTWAEFFDVLRKHPTLKTLALHPHLSGVKLLDPYDDQLQPMTEENAEDFFREAWNAVEALDREKKDRVEVGGWSPREDARMQRIWPHCSLDDKYGMISNSDGYNAVRFGEGQDHAAWLKLCDELEARGGGCKVGEATGDGKYDSEE